MESLSPTRRGEQHTAAATPKTTSAAPRPPPAPLAKGDKARGKRRILDDAAAAAGKNELSPRPAVGMATRRTRSQVIVETLDDAIAELIYGEDLPDKLVEPPHFLNLMRSAPAAYESPKRRRLEELCSGE